MDSDRMLPVRPRVSNSNRQPGQTFAALGSKWDRRRVGVRAMEPSQIAHAIAKRYWDGIRRDAVPSIAWRMWKRGDLKKYGAMYRLPENETPDTVLAERSGASFDGPLALAFDGPEEGGGT